LSTRRAVRRLQAVLDELIERNPTPKPRIRRLIVDADGYYTGRVGVLVDGERRWSFDDSLVGVHISGESPPPQPVESAQFRPEPTVRSTRQDPSTGEEEVAAGPESDTGGRFFLSTGTREDRGRLDHISSPGRVVATVRWQSDK